MECSLRFLTLGLIIFLVGTQPEYAQSSSNQYNQTLDSLHITRLSINKAAMLSLGIWSAGNMVVNGALMLSSNKSLNTNNEADKTAFYFQQMNVFWNVINLGLATSGYLSSASEPLHALSIKDVVEGQASIERILLLNAGLDVAYIATGAWFMERSKTDTSHSAQWQGYGQSLILQGGFLFAFDVAVFAIQHLSTAPLMQSVFENVRLGNNGGKLLIQLTLK